MREAVRPREHLDRLERSAAAIELPLEREPLEAEISALLAEFGEHEGQLRLVITRGGRRLAHREPARRGETVSLASVTYPPTRDPDRGQVPLLRRQHAGDAAGRRRRAPTRRCSSAPTASCSRPRPRRSSGRPDGVLRTPALDAGILESITRDADRPRARRRGGRFTDRGPPRRRRGVPRLDRARGPAGLARSTGPRCSAPGAAHQGGDRGLRPALAERRDSSFDVEPMDLSSATSSG